MLSDLSIIINAPDRLNEATRQRLHDDVAILTSADWLSQARELTVVDGADAILCNRLAAVVSEIRWRGLTVHVSGNGSSALRSSTAAAAAAVDAARACLENVLAHSGVAVAGIVVGQDDGESTIMVIDEGCGFGPAAVPADRLGLSVSVVGRVEDVGGYVRVWSVPGNGTSVLISVPALEVDPLSWYSGPLIPLAFATLVACCWLGPARDRVTSWYFRSTRVGWTPLRPGNASRWWTPSIAQTP